MLYTKHYQLSHALLFACLIALSACSDHPVVTKTQTYYLTPPAALIPECREPAFLGDTYGDAVEHTVQLQGAFSVCHIEIDTLNQWVKQHQPDNGVPPSNNFQGTPKGGAPDG